MPTLYTTSTGRQVDNPEINLGGEEIKRDLEMGENIYTLGGGWKLFQSSDTRTLPLEKQLEYWLSLLREKPACLTKISEMNCAAVLDCYLSIDQGVALMFSAELLARLAESGVGLKLNCFAFDAQRNEQEE